MPSIVGNAEAVHVECGATWLFECARVARDGSGRDLVFFLFPDVIRALSPAVRTAFVNAILTFKPVKPSAPAHKQTLSTLMGLLSH